MNSPDKEQSPNQEPATVRPRPHFELVRAAIANYAESDAIRRGIVPKEQPELLLDLSGAPSQAEDSK